MSGRVEWTTASAAALVLVTEPGTVGDSHGSTNDGPAVVIVSDGGGMFIIEGDPLQLVARLVKLAGGELMAERFAELVADHTEAQP